MSSLTFSLLSAPLVRLKFSVSLSLTMRGFALLIVLFSPSVPPPVAATAPDVFWLDKYGHLRWQDETAHLDNFAIALLNDANYTGYIYIQVSQHSCENEAIAHALKARNYLMNVRHLSWDRVAFRDLGYGDSFEVTLWLFPRGQPPRFVPDYQPATSTHIIEHCVHWKNRRQLFRQRGSSTSRTLNISERTFP